VVPDESHEEHGRLVNEVWIEVGVTNPAEGAWSAESARLRFVTFMTVVRSRPVTSAAMAR